MSLKLRGLIIVVLLSVTCIFATPSWMWIGTYAINNGPPSLPGLHYATETADAFFLAASNNHPGGPIPIRHVNLVGNNVTEAALEDSDREFCDFIFIGGHGWKRHMAIWPSNQISPPYKDWATSEMEFGVNFIRWVYLTGCNTLQYDNFNDFFYGVDSWDPAFRGVKCVLGYGSVGYLSSFSPGQVENFWTAWTNPSSPSSIWIAHSESTKHHVYEIGRYGIRPALVSSSMPVGAYYFMEDTYREATSERAKSLPTCTIWAVYGTPQY
jgi:hypothetical protein